MKNTLRLILMLILPMLASCADLSYYLHSINGHYAIVHQSRDIEEMLADKSTPTELTERLQLVSSIRQFAIKQLHLPESDSYTLYADLKRSYALKNMFAAGEFSVSAYRWCYPIVGCAGYRGYFEEQRLQEYSAKLKQQGFDVHITNVAAYSTLGWFDDPVLNTFINWPDYRLAGMIFHELAHQRVYIKGDSEFNESFAMAVQQLGVERRLEANADTERVQKYRQHASNRQQVIRLIEQGREQLKQLYSKKMDQQQKRLEKQRAMDALTQQYQRLSENFEVADGFKRWFEQGLNNAKLVSVSTYYSQIPAFKKIMQHHQGDFKKFLPEVEAIAALDTETRQQCLKSWLVVEKEAQTPEIGQTGQGSSKPLCKI